MGKQQDARSDVRDPVTGEAMIPWPNQDADYLAERALANPGNIAGAQHVAERIREKARQFGRLYINPRTGYQMRVKDDESPAAAENGAPAPPAGGASWHSARTVDSLEEELRRAHDRIRELERGPRA